MLDETSYSRKTKEAVRAEQGTPLLAKKKYCKSEFNLQKPSQALALSKIHGPHSDNLRVCGTSQYAKAALIAFIIRATDGR
jgi:hypothetical protein